MADRDDLDYFMEHAILSKDLRDLADRARAIRARERRLAELATVFYARFSMTIATRGSQELSTAEWDFVQRYEEAVK